MKIISFIPKVSVIQQILEPLNLWEQTISSDPPGWEPLYDNSGISVSHSEMLSFYC